MSYSNKQQTLSLEHVLGHWADRVDCLRDHRITERAFNSLANRFMKTLLRGEALRFFGRAVPFGIGAGIGGFANRALARKVVEQTQETFGQLPQWHQIPDLSAELSAKRERKPREIKGGQDRPAIEAARSEEAKASDS